MRVLHVGFGFRPWRWGGLIAYAEDLMDHQVAAGHDVGYFFRGRQYPFMTRTRMKQWERRRIRMFEVVNGSIPVNGDDGTPRPELELHHAPTERAFRRALDTLEPDVVHFHEMLGLPTSLFDLAADRGRALMTLQDYQVLCPTIKLFDADGNVCLRTAPGAMCRVCSRHATDDPKGMVDGTMLFEQTRVLEAVPGLKHVPRPRPVVRLIRGAGGVTQDAWRARRAATAPVPEAPPEDPLARMPPAAAYDERRAVNVARLSRLQLVAMSNRVAEIYRNAGVDPAAVQVLHLTLEHIDDLRPRRIDAVEGPVRFATLAGCASPQKGSDVVLRAVELLRAGGFTAEDYTLEVRGYVHEPARDALEAAPEVIVGGVYGPEHMNDLLPRWHVGIVPSIWEEAYGYVGVEFLAGGVPVIGNAIGGIPDYCVDGETGWLNRTRDGDGLAAIMASIIRDRAQVPALNARILERRADLVKPFPAHAREIEALYAGTP
jgi:glycosyltransferase involved in cell wall biosynthesis